VSDAVIRFEDVVQRFRVIQERPDTLRELFTKLYHRRTSYHEFEAVRHVSFEVQPGTTMGIIGRNGSGKSTILKIIAGVYKPSSGRVTVQGTVAPLIELGAGFHHELTGRENILINGLLLGLTRRQIQEREQSIIDFADIGDFIDSPVKQYSSGMYMRLSFAVATEVHPDILLIDEILSVGDALFQDKCNVRMRRFRELGKTLIMVSHDMRSIANFCDRVLLVDKGELLEDGPADYVIGRYRELMGQPASLAVSERV
jgi:ABC-type polysaccharide/polyol phosphate transport system ATPase subunit